MFEVQRKGSSGKKGMHDARKLEIIEETRCCLTTLKGKGSRCNGEVNFWKEEKELLCRDRRE